MRIISDTISGLGLPADDMVLPGRIEVSRAAMTLERGDISPSLNITCLHAPVDKKKRVKNPTAAEKIEKKRTYANGVCKSRLESDSVPSPSNSLSNLSISISSISASSEAPPPLASCLPSGKLNFLVTDGLRDEEG